MAEVAETSSRWSWWEAWPMMGLVLLGGVMLFARLGTLPYHGEESRRVQIAREMVHSGDYLVPRLQGHPWPTKPPLFYWMLAGLIAATDSLDPWLLRIPSALATLFTALLLAWYVRPSLSRLGAFATGFVFLTFGDILDSGYDAEIDATFTLFVTASLLLWHGGMQRGWSPTLCWTLGYACAALAFLTKGLQGPIYFGAATYAWLLFTRRWRWLFHPGQLLGIAVFLSLALAWMLPFAATEGTNALRAVFVSESVGRTMGGWDAFLRHLLMFPMKWAGSLLPWSPLLLAYVSASVRQQVRTQHAETCFAGLVFALAFPTCWLPPGGEERYLRPVLPCVAAMLGTLLHLLAEPATRLLMLHWVWRGFAAAWAVALVVGGMGLLGVSLVAGPTRLPDWQEPWPLALGFALLATGVGGGLIWVARRAEPWHTAPAFLMVGLLAWVCVTGVLVNRGLRRQVDGVGAVARLRSQLPGKVRLVSYGPVNHLFLLLYEDPVERQDWPQHPHDSSALAGDFFCFDAFRGAHPPLPFVWEEVARLSMDRTHRPQPDNVVIVGRRVEPHEAVVRRGDPTLHGFFP